MSFIDDIKPWFETGDYPTQAQFYAMFDKLRWKDEAIAISEVTNLTQIINELAQPIQVFVTNADPYTYIIPVDFLLEKIIIKPVIDTNGYCTSEGGEDGDIVPIDDDNVISAARGATWEVNQLAIGSARNILIQGLPVGTTLVFIKRKTIL